MMSVVFFGRDRTLHRGMVCLSLLLCLLPFVARGQAFGFISPSGHLLKGNVVGGGLEVSKWQGAELTGALVIPSSVSYQGTLYSVRRIGSFALTGITSVSIPNSARVIVDSAFRGCTGLTTVSLGDSVRDIGRCAFYRCTGLLAVVLPAMLETVGEYAFAGCSALGDTLVIPSSVVAVGGYAFRECRRLRGICVNGSLGSLPDECFAYCDSLEWVDFGSGVDSLGRSVFFDCFSLVSIALPEGLKYIGIGAFERCGGLTEMVVPDSVAGIDDYAFSWCTAMRRLTLGSGVESLGRSVFNQCDALDTIVVRPLVPPSVETTTFNNTSQGKVFVVPCGRVEDYRSAWGSGLTFAEPQPELTLTLGVNDTLRGTVSMGDGVGCDSTAVVAASPFRGYRFERWSNGRTANPDTLYLTGDSVLTAFFEPQLYTVDVQVNDEGWGMATGSGVYEYGTEAELAATALAGYVFVHWNDGSVDNPRRVRVESDTVFVAEFAPAGAVEAVEGEKRVRVYAEWQHDNAAIVVEGALGRPVNVVDRLGRGVLTMAYTPERLRIPVSGNGIYIVRVGNSVPVVVIPSAGCR